MRYNDCGPLRRDPRVTTLPTVGNKPFDTPDASDTRTGRTGLRRVDWPRLPRPSATPSEVRPKAYSKEDAVMSTKHWGFATVAILAVALWLVTNSRSHADEGPALEQGQEVLTHGPVH